MGEREKAPGVEVPYIVYEGTNARWERTSKRFWIALLVTIALLVASNAYWIYNWMQYDYSVTAVTAQQDGRGINIVGGGNVAYGTDSPDYYEDAHP